MRDDIGIVQRERNGFASFYTEPAGLVGQITARLNRYCPRSFDLGSMWIRNLFCLSGHVVQDRMSRNLLVDLTIFVVVGKRFVQFVNRREQVAKLSRVGL